MSRIAPVSHADFATAIEHALHQMKFARLMLMFVSDFPELRVKYLNRFYTERRAVRTLIRIRRDWGRIEA